MLFCLPRRVSFQRKPPKKVSLHGEIPPNSSSHRGAHAYTGTVTMGLTACALRFHCRNCEALPPLMCLPSFLLSSGSCSRTRSDGPSGMVTWNWIKAFSCSGSSASDAAVKQVGGCGFREKSGHPWQWGQGVQEATSTFMWLK